MLQIWVLILLFWMLCSFRFSQLFVMHSFFVAFPIISIPYTVTNPCCIITFICLCIHIQRKQL